ncbi:MAG: MBOAT family protein [Candidatus Omnitrophica bacterium]|nr:MBOAT family protein [Candidatus Omnitrophota bacterium]
MNSIAIFSISLVMVFLVYWFLLPKGNRSLFLLICSLIFIAWFGIGLALYFLINTAVVYMAGSYMSRRPADKGLIVRCTLIWLIASLCFFKYTNTLFDLLFKTESLFLSMSDPVYSRILLPLGISYVTFRLIHYTVETYKGNAPRSSFADFALYVLFFPTFLAGPVDRFERFYPQSGPDKRLDISDVNYGLFRIACGIIRKVFIADSLARVVMPILAVPQQHSRPLLLACMYGLSIRIYMDFAGYTDMAIGISRLFGYRIMENFNRPYLQKNIALFWRSWHISVYAWIRDYFFFPVFGHKASTLKLYLGIISTAMLFMLWHRGSSSFFILGLYCSLGFIIWQAFQELKARHPLLRRALSKRWLDPLSILITFNFVSVSQLFFIFSAKDAVSVLGAIF